MSEKYHRKQQSTWECLTILAALLISFLAAYISEKIFHGYGYEVAGFAFIISVAMIGVRAEKLKNRRDFIDWVRFEYPDLSEKAILGDAQQQCDLGYAIWLKDLKREFIPATYWWFKAAERGNIGAQEALAAHYSSGHDALIDLEKAAYWYRKAAQQGSADAQLKLGILCFSGTGVPKDLKEAVSWYLKASRHGPGKWNLNFASPEAQLRLGACYYFGWGVEEDYVEAYAYYSLGELKKENDRKIFTALEKQLTASEIEDGKRRVKEITKVIIEGTPGKTGE